MRFLRLLRTVETPYACSRLFGLLFVSIVSFCIEMAECHEHLFAGYVLTNAVVFRYSVPVVPLGIETLNSLKCGKRGEHGQISSGDKTVNCRRLLRFGRNSLALDQFAICRVPCGHRHSAPVI